VSNISYQTINEDFPVAGQDNDTQVFRDNFDAIKQGLRVANEEITDLQDNVARTDVNTDYNLKKIQNAVLENVREQKLLGFDGNGINISPTTVDFQNGNYQIFKVGSGNASEPFIFDFLNFPGDPSLFGSSDIGVGKVTLELYSDGQERTVAFRTTGTTLIKKNNFPAMPVGSFGDLTVKSVSDPVVVEIWRWGSQSIYIKYLGFLDTLNTEGYPGNENFFGNSSAVIVSDNQITVDCEVDISTVTLASNITNVSFINTPPLGLTKRILLVVAQDSIGNRNIATSGFLYPSNPTNIPISIIANSISVVEFVVFNGNIVLAHLLGSNYS
jgi:hypothetical protein